MTSCRLFTRSSSPNRARSPAFADSTFSAVQAALNKRQLQVSELRTKLNALRDQSDNGKRELAEKETLLRQTQTQLMDYQQEVETAYVSYSPNWTRFVEEV